MTPKQFFVQYALITEGLSHLSGNRRSQPSVLLDDLDRIVLVNRNRTIMAVIWQDGDNAVVVGVYDDFLRLIDSKAEAVSETVHDTVAEAFMAAHEAIGFPLVGSPLPGKRIG